MGTCRAHLHQRPRSQDILLDRGLDPPHGISSEPKAPLWLKALDGLHQTKIRFRNEIGYWQPIAAIFHRDLLAASSAAALRAGAAGEIRDDRALFWQFGSGASASTIFGYDRVAASLVPEIVDDGSKRAAATKRVIQDFPAKVVFPTIETDASLQPVVERLDARTAAAFRAFVQQSFAQLAPTTDKMPGIRASMLLMGEGQTPPNPTVGGTIVESALKLGRPSTVLISDTELRGMVLAPNLTALDKRIGQDTIAYLLDLRTKGGPIGRRAALRRAPRRRHP